MESELDKLRIRVREFTKARDWEQFHTPRNLILALVGEVGELAEAYQWGDTGSSKEKAAEEIADIGIYLIRLCDVLNIDLLAAIASKIDLNESKYPVHLAKGNAKKYTELK